jgi:peroxisomal 3,2-trans-enoyl-CoA isomerase
MSSSNDAITIDYRGKIAIITLNVPKKLNALSGENYYKLARAMHKVAEHDEVFITILTGNGRFFSAYVYLPQLPCSRI